MRAFLQSLFYLMMYRQAVGTQAQHPPHQALKLYMSTLCKPREMLVKVEDEFPEVMLGRVVPSCVPLQRCGCCCSDEAMMCVNVAKHTTMIQLQQLSMDSEGNIAESVIELPFVEHSQCQCRFRDQF